MIIQHISRGIYEAKQSWKYIIKHIEPKLLVASSHLFLVPNIISIFYPPPGFIPIMPILLTTFVISMAFWSDPVKQSHVHRIDGIVAKATIIVFILYVFSYTKQPTYFSIALGLMILFFLLSRVFSSQVWCSPQHLIVHCCAHIIGVICICFIWL